MKATPAISRPALSDARTTFRSLCKLAAILALTALTTACSPYVYGKEVGAFATGVQMLTGAYATARTDDAAYSAERQRDAMIANHASPSPASGAAAASPARPPHLNVASACEVSPDLNPPPAADHPQREDEPHPIDPGCHVTTDSDASTALDRHASDVLFYNDAADALNGYVAALQAITTATDRTDLDAASSALTASVAKIAPKDNADRVTAVGGLLSNLLGAGLDARRLQALREGVRLAHPRVETAATALGAFMDTVRVNRAAAHKERLDQLINGMEATTLSADAYAAHVTQVQAEAAAIETLRVARPRDAARKLIAAHAALLAALNDNSRQTEAVFQALQDFAAAVQKLREAFNAAPGGATS